MHRTHHARVTHTTHVLLCCRLSQRLRPSYRVGPAATAPTAEEDAVVIDLTLNHTAILLGPRPHQNKNPLGKTVQQMGKAFDPLFSSGIVSLVPSAYRK